MKSLESISQTTELLRLERQADLEYYRQKVLLRSLHERTQEGTTWYPVRLKREYLGTGERLIVEVDRSTHLDQPHAFQSGKSVSLFSNASGKPEKHHTNGVINYVRDNTMVITLSGDELPDWIDLGQLGVDVMFDEMSYREMEYAMKELANADGNRLAEIRELLLGVEPASSDILRVHKVQQQENQSGDFISHEKQETRNSLLNSTQQQALTKVVNTSHIAFIHGPPGTGKTTTLVHAILHVVKEENQVLVCAPSNAAVDLLTEKLSELGLNVIRIGHPARVTEQTLSKTLDFRITEHPYFQELKTLRKKMEQTKSVALKFKRKFGHFEKGQRRSLLQEAKKLKADADLLEFHIIRDLLQNCQVLSCTLVGSSHPVMRGRKFKTVFIDEAGQALEPACWIPLLRSQRAIFAGDHQQLPPTIKSNEAARAGLSRTLFEKGIGKFPELSSMLKVQYRMHEDIMKFSSKYFYNNELIAHESVRRQLLKPDEAPVEFIDTAGAGFSEGQDPETLSRYNQQEADLLLRITERLIENIGPEEWMQRGITLGIITPYRAQVDLLHKLAESSAILEPLNKSITINTVDAFQGQERDAIVISFVRSNEKGEVGFLADIRRTNVAMTRARNKLIMIGDSATLGSHPFYLELLEFVQKEGFYKSSYEI